MIDSWALAHVSEVITLWPRVSTTIVAGLIDGMGERVGQGLEEGPQRASSHRHYTLGVGETSARAPPGQHNDQRAIKQCPNLELLSTVSTATAKILDKPLQSVLVKEQTLEYQAKQP